MGEGLDTSKNKIIILGGGLTGLSAGYQLSKAGEQVVVFEGDATVGGLSKTIVRGEYRFDLGGHRFFTKDKKINAFVADIMGDELIFVPRKSKIFLRDKYFDYPLKPFNAMLGLGFSTTAKIMADYCIERLKRFISNPAAISLEDWVVSNFGRTMFDIYFKEYTEKVWGIGCDRISMDWVAQRIRGLSLLKAVKNAILKSNGKDIPSLVDRFVYPKLGIGRISDRLCEEIERAGSVSTDTRVDRINHSNDRIDSIEVSSHTLSSTESGAEIISTIPLTNLLNIMKPAPPRAVMSAASKLRYRDLVVVGLMINRERVTDQTWIYIPEKRIPFGRIHEPKNWSMKMAPEGRTLLVIEYFSFIGDRFWNETDERLADITVKNLEHLGFLNKKEVIDSTVVRVPRAYPLFEVGYREHSDVLYDYLKKFSNLHIAGRNGMFRYYNMDHAIASGVGVAEGILKKNTATEKADRKKYVCAGREGCDVR
jgi:protoporphyrinogen oxidase